MNIREYYQNYTFNQQKMGRMGNISFACLQWIDDCSSDL